MSTGHCYAKIIGGQRVRDLGLSSFLLFLSFLSLDFELFSESLGGLSSTNVVVDDPAV